MGGEFDDAPHVADDNVLRGGSHLLGHPGVGLEVALLPMDRDEELGPDQGVDDFQLVLAGVAGHMHFIHGFVNHFAAPL